LVENGSGALNLTGVNTYSGATTINGGSLAIGGAGQLGGGSYAGAVTDNGALSFGSSAAQTLSGVISGSGSLANSGSGTLTLSGANTYAGGTTATTTSDITSLTVANNTALGTGPVVLIGGNQYGGTLSVNSGITITNAITMRPSTSGSGRAGIALAANSRLTGPIIVDGVLSGNLAIFPSSANSSSSPAVISGSISHTNGNANTVDLRGSGCYGKITGNIAYGSGTVALVDTTSWELSGANTYGALNVDNASATLYCGAANTLSALGVVEDGGVGGTLKLSNLAGTAAYNQTVAGLTQTIKVSNSLGTPTLTISNNTVNYAATNTISGTLSLVKAGTSTQTLCGTNTYTGSTAISSGTLALSGNGRIVNSPGISVGSSAVFDVSGVTGGYALASGQTLSGSGLVNGAITVGAGGTLQPGLGGLDTSTLTVNGTLMLAGKAVFLLNRTNAQNSTRIAGISTVTFGGTLTVTNAGPALQLGDTFTLIASTNYTGASFAATNLPALSANLAWNTDALASAGTISVVQLPVITNQPQSLVVNPGSSAGFTVGATGTGALAYQWLLNGTNIAGAVTNIYSIAGATAANAGSYTVIISNNYGAVTSSVAHLVVNLPPMIGSVSVANSAGFSLSASGSVGETCVLLGASNLVPPVVWLQLQTNTADMNGVFNFTDAQATNFPQRFYRLMTQ
jgi:autotransporter-associated beta strand protein